MKRRRKFLIVLLALALAGYLTVRFVIAPFVVVGDSMEPTLRSWDFCLMTRTRHYQPQRGDIVMFRTADDPPLRFVKRVLALPGETVSIRNGAVWIDGRSLPEPYTTTPAALEIEPTLVSPGQVFVIGDNRDGSLYALVATRLVEARLAGHWRWKR